MADTRSDPDPHGLRQEAQDRVRGAAAGAIVGMPPLYTMEMWWHGMGLSAGGLLAVLAVTLVANFLFCEFSGFRERPPALGAASEAVTAVALGAVFSLLVLWLIGEAGRAVSWPELLGKVVVETVPVSLGISFANIHVGNSNDEAGEGNKRPEAAREGEGSGSEAPPRAVSD